MNIGERIKQRRKELNISADAVAEKLGVSRSTIFRYEKGDIEKLPTNILDDISSILNTTPAYLMGWSEDKDISFIYNKLDEPRQLKVYSFAEKQLEQQNNIVAFPKNFPIVGKTAANPSILEYGDVNVEQGSFEHIPEGADCAILIQGDSMEPLIKDGEIVFYRRQEDIENGEIAIVEINGDGVTCKKVYFNVEEETIILKSINEKYQDREISDEDIRIVGKVLLK